MNPKPSFWWGFVGAALPEIIRFWKIVQAGQDFPHLRWYYFVVAAFFLVGAGLLSVAWKPENAFKAIWVGVSFPVIVSTLAQTPPSLPH